MDGHGYVALQAFVRYQFVFAFGCPVRGGLLRLGCEFEVYY